MDRRTRHRTVVYSPNPRGDLVEIRIRKAPTAEEAVKLAVADGRRWPLGAVAYTVEIDGDGFECGQPEVLGRFGNVPHADPMPF